MMKKVILPVIMFMTLALCPLIADTSTDNSSDRLGGMKFRGQSYMVFTFHPPRQEGVAVDYLLPVTSKKLDYTTAADLDYKHHSPGDSGRIIGQQGLEFKIFSEYSMIAPFLKFDHPLLQNNNIALKFKFDISPLTITGGAELVWEPIAFLYFNAGFLIGSGWNDNLLGRGLAINNWGGYLPNERKGMLEERHFTGPLMLNWFSTTLQFDLAALMPEPAKRWTHVVFTATPKLVHKSLLNYNFYDIAYEWEADHGVSMNGWFFTFDAILGYRIPVIIDKRKEEGEKKMFRGFVRHNDFMITAAVILQIERMHLTHFDDSPMASGGWGSDFVPLRFGPALQLDLPNNFFFGMAVHFRNGIEYTSSTVGNNYFMDRGYEDWYLCLERIGFMFGWQF